MDKKSKGFKKLNVGEREYTANMIGPDGRGFTVIVKAFNTADALLKIKNKVADGSTLRNITIVDEFGNKF